MGRYSKSYSNYVLKKRHQQVKGGTIFERDWGTLGERHSIEPGKRTVYADSSFLFTDNTRTGNRYRNNTGEWSDPYTQEDLDNKVDNTVNDTSLLDESNDIRDYAYYGSAVELVRASIESIVKWFPGKFWTSGTKISRVMADGQRMYISQIVTDGHHNYAIGYSDSQDDCNIFVVENPFTIDFYTTNATFDRYTNNLRNMPQSFKQYELNGNDILTWDVWIKPYNECDGDYTIKYDIKLTYKVNNESKSGHLYGMLLNGEAVWCTDIEQLNVQPKENIIENYFSGLKGFEAKLLSRKYKPEYTAKLITPIPYSNNNPNYSYVERSYSWPHDGYCIFVDSIGFENYVNSLYKLANIMDEMWCDNIWRNMTHEAITNFDWTYTKNYEEGQEEENILGGTRMEGILRIWGRCYDDIKRYIDGISLKNCVTYDNSSPNLANAELSDKAELLGWEVYSTKTNKDNNIYLDSSALYDNDKWYDSRNIEMVSQNDVDNHFMNKLLLSSGEIFRTKGTKQAIEMVFALFGIGSDDFAFKEIYYSVKPKGRDDSFSYYKHVIGTGNMVSGHSFDNFDDFISELKSEGLFDDYITIGGDTYERIDTTVGEFCEAMIINKSAALYYEDDEFSGTPIRDVFINNRHYIVPYFTQNQVYDGYVYFESKGGWGKITGEEDADAEALVKKYHSKEFNYLETIPYMEIVQNVSELMETNMFQIGDKKIFYVMDISDITVLSENIPSNVSHFFKLADPNHPNSSSSWRNIPSDGNTEGNNLFDGVDEDDIKLAQYNDKLFLDNLGNNPHCGYGSYDLGTEYREYLETPFKYPVENYGFTDPTDRESAAQFIFNVETHDGNKILNLTKRDVWHNSPNQGEDDELKYYLPSKVLVIENKISNERYKEYLKDIIMKYVLQVIPTTTILILQNFE